MGRISELTAMVSQATTDLFAFAVSGVRTYRETRQQLSDWIVKTGFSFVAAGSGASARTVQAKGRDIISLPDYGGVGDNSTDCSTAITNADALGQAVFVPNGTYLGSSIAATDLDGPYWSFDGQIKNSDGNKRGKFFSALKAAPASFGTSSSVSTAFNGDLSKQLFTAEYRITGSDTLGTTGEIASDGHRSKVEFGPFFLYLFNQSGRSDNSANDTGVAAIRVQADAASSNGGNTAAFRADGNLIAARTPTGAFDRTSVTLFTGQATAAVANGYLNPLEFFLDDQNFDSQAVGLVLRFKRANVTGANGAFWHGIRIDSSEGSEPLDAGIFFNGKINFGIDFTQATLTNQAAIALKQNQRIYFNATAGTLPKGASATGDSYLTYNSVASKVVLTVAGANVAQFDASHIWMPTGGGMKVNGVQVVSNQGAAVADAAGGATIDAEARTALNALLARLRTHGMIAT